MISNLTGQALGARSNAYIDPYPLKVLYEVDYKKHPSVTLTDGGTFSVGGIWHQVGNVAGSSINVVSGSGLVLNAPTNGGLCTMSINPVTYMGKETSVKTMVGADRFRRGGWAIWAKCGNYNAPTGGWFYIPYFHSGAYPGYHIGNRRGYNINGTAANSTGGWASWATIGFDIGAAMYGAVTSSANVSVMYFRSLYEIEHYYGSTTTDTWPDFENLTLGGVSRPAFFSKFDATNAVYSSPGSYTMNFGATASAAGVTITIEKWRFTSWD